jgi:hypothetical protein
VKQTARQLAWLRERFDLLRPSPATVTPSTSSGNGTTLQGMYSAANRENLPGT